MIDLNEIPLEHFSGEVSQLTADKARDIREELSSGYADRCVICGDVQYDAYDAKIEGGARAHSMECYQCGSHLAFFEIYIVVEDGVKVAFSKYMPQACHRGDCMWTPVPINKRRVTESESLEIKLPYPKILNSRIEEHHISYEPEVTIPVCSVCHGQIHSDDSDLQALQPDMSRKEWEQ